MPRPLLALQDSMHAKDKGSADRHLTWMRNRNFPVCREIWLRFRHWIIQNSFGWDYGLCPQRIGMNSPGLSVNQISDFPMLFKYSLSFKYHPASWKPSSFYFTVCVRSASLWLPIAGPLTCPSTFPSGLSLHQPVQLSSLSPAQCTMLLHGPWGWGQVSLTHRSNSSSPPGAWKSICFTDEWMRK